jgi:hypothetical protein
MIQRLLAERFSLRLHSETKEALCIFLVGERAEKRASTGPLVATDGSSIRPLCEGSRGFCSRYAISSGSFEAHGVHDFVEIVHQALIEAVQLGALLLAHFGVGGNG